MGIPHPTTSAGRDGMAALLRQPSRALVTLDFDGTLADIVADPEQARARPDAVAAMARLAPRVGSLAVLTGRPAEVAVRFGGFADVAGLENLVVLGHYGAERYDAGTGTVTAPPPDPGVVAATAELPDVLADAGAAGQVWLEDKERSVAVHTRQAPDPRGTFELLRGPLRELARRHALTLEPGRLVLELRPAGMDKGIALSDYAREVGAAAVLYAGDDLGDLAAFAAVDALRTSGVPGVRVCSVAVPGEAATELVAHADLTVDGPAGVAGLLAALADALGPPAGP